MRVIIEKLEICGWFLVIAACVCAMVSTGYKMYEWRESEISLNAALDSLTGRECSYWRVRYK